MILNIDDEICSKVGLSFSRLTQLETIGFIKFDNVAGFVIRDLLKVVILNYYGTALKIEFRKNSDNILDIGKVVFTESGKQLAPICGSKINPEFIGYAMEYYKEEDDIVSMTINK